MFYVFLSIYSTAFKSGTISLKILIAMYFSAGFTDIHLFILMNSDKIFSFY